MGMDIGNICVHTGKFWRGRAVGRFVLKNARKGADIKLDSVVTGTFFAKCSRWTGDIFIFNNANIVHLLLLFGLILAPRSTKRVLLAPFLIGFPSEAIFPRRAHINEL